MNNQTKIGLAGSGWGFWAALKGLLTEFENIEIYNPVETKELNNFSEEQQVNFSYTSSLEEFKSDIIVCAGLKDIITIDLLNTKKFINIHPSLLPTYRGLHSTVWAMLNNESAFGYTVHEMNEYIDDGPIIYQFRIENDFFSNSRYYMELFNTDTEKNLGKVVSEYLKGIRKAIPQDKTNASWVGRRNMEDCKIDFNQNNEYLERFFRALCSPYPTPFFIYKDEKLFPTSAKFHDSKVKSHIGRILNVDNEGIWISTGSGYIIFSEVKNEQGNSIDLISTFKIGTKLIK